MSWRAADRDELLEATGASPYVDVAVPADAVAIVGEHGWAAMHPWRPSGHWGGAALVAPGAPPEAESQALAELLALAPDTPLEWFSTSAERQLAAPPGFLVDGSGRWDFLSTRVDVPPAGAVFPGDLELLELDDATDAAELEAFGRAHNTDFEGFPGHGFSVLWLGLRDASSALVAIGGMHLLATGAPHLSGIVVDRAQRGRGIGRALTVALTGRALDRCGVSTLGVFSSNAPAISLYHSLGYRTHHRFHTRVMSAL